jgi:hypothetical protein
VYPSPSEVTNVTIMVSLFSRYTASMVEGGLGAML